MRFYKIKGQRILFCPGCKRVYENVRLYGGVYRQEKKHRVYQRQAGKKPKYYTGLPTYGLIREICPECVLNAIKTVKAKNKKGGDHVKRNE